MSQAEASPTSHDELVEKHFTSFRLAERKFGLREILTEVFLNGRIFLIALFAPILISLVLSLLATKTYVSEARLLVMPSREHMMQGPMGMMSIGGMGAETRIVRAEAEILGSRALRDKTLTALGPDNIYPKVSSIADQESFEQALSIAAAEMDEDLAIRFLPNTNIIALSYKHEDTELSALLLNTMIGIYLEQRREIFADVGIDVLAGELKQFEEILAKHDADMETLRGQAGVNDFGSERQAMIRRLTTLELDQVRAEVDIKGLQAQEEELKKLINLIPEQISEFSEDAGLSALNQALDNLRKLEMERGNLIERFEKGSRFIVEIDKKVVLAQQSVSKLQKLNVDQNRTGRNDVFDEVQQDIINTQADKRALEAEIAARAHAIGDTSQRIDELNVLETKYNQLQRQRVILEANYKAYAMKYEQERLTKAVEANFDDSTIRVIEHAMPPLEGESKKQAIIILGVLAGLFLSATALYISRITRNVMVTPEEVEDELKLPVLMSINDKRLLLMKDG